MYLFPSSFKRRRNSNLDRRKQANGMNCCSYGLVGNGGHRQFLPLCPGRVRWSAIPARKFGVASTVTARWLGYPLIWRSRSIKVCAVALLGCGRGGWSKLPGFVVARCCYVECALGAVEENGGRYLGRLLRLLWAHRAGRERKYNAGMQALVMVRQRCV